MDEKIVIDMKQIRLEKCSKGGHDFGYHTISHGEITHPLGDQVCLTCDKTFKQLIEQSRRQQKEAFVKDLDEAFDLGKEHYRDELSQFELDEFKELKRKYQD